MLGSVVSVDVSVTELDEGLALVPFKERKFPEPDAVAQIPIEAPPAPV